MFMGHPYIELNSILSAYIPDGLITSAQSIHCFLLYEAKSLYGVAKLQIRF